MSEFGAPPTIADAIEPLRDIRPARPATAEDLHLPAPTLGTVYEASREANRVDRSDFETQMLADGYGPIVEALGLDQSQNPVRFHANGGSRNPILIRSDLLARQGRGSSLTDRATQEQLIVAEIKALRARNPKALPGIPDTVAGLRKYFLDNEAKRRKAGVAVTDRAEGIGGLAANLAGGLVQLGTDPINVASMPIGGAGGTLGRVFVRETLINGLLEGLQTPIVDANRETIGEDLSAGEALANIAIGGLAGGALETGLTGAFRAAAPFADRLTDKVTELRIARGIASADVPAQSGVAIGDLLADLPDRDLAETLRFMVGDEALTPDERAAVNVLTREAEIADGNPFVAGPAGDAAHAEDLSEAIDALSENRQPRPSAGAADPAPVAGSGGRAAGEASTAPAAARSSPRRIPAGLPSDIVDGLKRRGIADHVARGSAAGIVAESRGSTAIVNPTSGAYGLGQWLGPRKRELFRRYGPSPTREQQLDFLAWELKGGDHGGRKVLAAADEVAALNSYIRDFMRPAAGRETSGDLERGMAALGRAGERIEAGLASGEVTIDPEIARLRGDAMALDQAVIGEEAVLGGGRIPPLYRRTVSTGDYAVDAARFQFRSEIDGAGVTDKLRGVEEWNPWAANPLILWEDRAGKLWLADGHQRTGLAKSIEGRTGERIELMANIMRESDGVSAEDARVYAALINIGDEKATLIDAAKVMKVAPELLEAALPPLSPLVRHGRGLARLSDPAFGAVINGVIAPDHAAAIGRLLPDNPEAHEDMVRILADADPANAAQAENIVRMAINAGFHNEEQIGLFGTEMVTRSLFKERARVLEKGLARLRKMKLLYRTATDGADALEAAGSTIARDASAREAQANAEAIEIVNRLATRAGPVGDALTAAATRFAGGARIADVVAEFTDAVRGLDLGDLTREAGGNAGDGRSVDGGGFDGDADEAGSSLFDQFDEQPTLSEIEAATARFDDPDGEAVRQQADSLAHDFRSELAGQGQGAGDRGVTAEMSADEMFAAIRALPDTVESEDALAALRATLWEAETAAGRIDDPAGAISRFDEASERLRDQYAPAREAAAAIERARALEIQGDQVAAIQQHLRQGGTVTSQTQTTIMKLTDPGHIRDTAGGLAQVMERGKWVAVPSEGLERIAAQAGWRPVRDIDLSHYEALQRRLTNEQDRLAQARNDGERAQRQVTVDGIKREIEGELEFLGIDKTPEIDMDDQALLDALAEDLAELAPISDRVAEALEARGFERQGDYFQLRVEGLAEAGTLSDGARIVTLRMDEQGRYLERVDGFDVANDVDLREFDGDPEGAIERVLTDKQDPAVAERLRQELALRAASPMRPEGVDPLASAADAMTFRLSEEGDEISGADLLAEIEADKKAIDDIEGCL